MEGAARAAGGVYLRYVASMQNLWPANRFFDNTCVIKDHCGACQLSACQTRICNDLSRPVALCITVCV